ncbi:hypothetical protein GCG54_00003828 [Colletotrichum gloeosporioides]|uniref:Uncharacterized protein n=1 Tax=Colletotrichum gloeosporioides TaxID=474922 RepID=A0A8H4CE55_COLGL|nr:uncharacterized protein GCG54_00003828 [Colletotrichum gloeosporioides]KAF3802365.1 hypothetical protein GCG54_00003828 [Colletotrichum gloeosporioides]
MVVATIPSLLFAPYAAFAFFIKGPNWRFKSPPEGKRFPVIFIFVSIAPRPKPIDTNIEFHVPSRSKRSEHPIPPARDPIHSPTLTRSIDSSMPQTPPKAANLLPMMTALIAPHLTSQQFNLNAHLQDAQASNKSLFVAMQP